MNSRVSEKPTRARGAGLLVTSGSMGVMAGDFCTSTVSSGVAGLTFDSTFGSGSTVTVLASGNGRILPSKSAGLVGALLPL
jgi:hypothetical protein